MNHEELEALVERLRKALHMVQTDSLLMRAEYRMYGVISRNSLEFAKMADEIVEPLLEETK